MTIDTTHPLFALMRARISANKFDTQRKLTEEQIRTLVEYAGQAPSANNQQHWRFIAVVSTAAKERLKAASFAQQKVVDAAVTVIVLGDLRAYELMPLIAERTRQAGLFDQRQVERAIASTAAAANNPQALRDEAIRSCGLAAMNLMLAAQALGLVSGPMIGFEPERVMREFDIDPRYVPAMLITVGYPAPGNWPRKPRLTVDETLLRTI